MPQFKTAQYNMLFHRIAEKEQRTPIEYEEIAKETGLRYQICCTENKTLIDKHKSRLGLQQQEPESTTRYTK